MVHFGSVTLGHDALGNILQSGTISAGIAAGTIQKTILDPITQRFLANVPISISSGQSTQNIIDTLKERSQSLDLLSFAQQTLNISNLIGLGEVDKRLSDALNTQITIRENQRAADNDALLNTQLAIGSINERLSGEITELGAAISDLGQGVGGGFDPIKFFTDNPLIGGIGIGGLAVGAVVLLLVLK